MLGVVKILPGLKDFLECLSSVGIWLKFTITLFMKLLSVSSNFDFKASPILTEYDCASLVL